MVNRGRFTQQLRLAHPLTSETSIHTPLGTWPGMPAASVALSPTNQILSLTDLTRNLGQGREGLGLAPASLMFYSKNVLPGKGSLPGMVSCQLSRSQSRHCPSWFWMELSFALGASV